MKQLSNGIWIPNHGQEDYDWALVEIGIPALLMDSIERQNKTIENIIHAGGNMGIYALEFAKRAKNVYVFEPEADNFSALSMNCAGKNNIFLYKAALGNGHSPISLSNPDKNHCGGWQIENQNGHIPMLTIDDLNLSQVSIIHLDIEGYELFAIQGAETTIKKNYPLLAFELAEHNRKYKYTKSQLLDYVVSLGYNYYQEYSREIMFMRGD